MAKIELLFGGPTTSREEISIENYAYDWGTSIETAVIKSFHRWIEFLLNKKTDHGDGFFELLLFIDTNQMLKLPKISAGTYRHNGYVLPKMMIHGDYGVVKETGDLVFLSEQLVNFIGSNFEEYVEYEYFEFHRSAMVASKQPSEVL